MTKTKKTQAQAIPAPRYAATLRSTCEGYTITISFSDRNARYGMPASLVDEREMSATIYEFAAALERASAGQNVGAGIPFVTRGTWAISPRAYDRSLAVEMCEKDTPWAVRKLVEETLTALNIVVL